MFTFLYHRSLNNKLVMCKCNSHCYNYQSTRNINGLKLLPAKRHRPRHTGRWMHWMNSDEQLRCGVVHPNPKFTFLLTKLHLHVVRNCWARSFLGVLKCLCWITPNARRNVTVTRRQSITLLVLGRPLFHAQLLTMQRFTTSRKIKFDNAVMQCTTYSGTRTVRVAVDYRVDGYL